MKIYADTKKNIFIALKQEFFCNRKFAKKTNTNIFAISKRNTTKLILPLKDVHEGQSIL